jgi:formylmethanofuran dehydrogenase subunit E
MKKKTQTYKCNNCNRDTYIGEKHYVNGKGVCNKCLKKLTKKSQQ